MSDGNEIDMLHTLKLLPESSQRFTNLITAPIDLAGFLPVAVLGYFLVPRPQRGQRFLRNGHPYYSHGVAQLYRTTLENGWVERHLRHAPQSAL
jgi:hypothetical protein